MRTAYATAEDYAAYTGGPIAESRLIRASALIDLLVSSADYVTGSRFDTARALREATCAAVEWQRTANPAVRSRVSGDGASDGSAHVARVGPEAVRVLTAAGLLGDPPVRHWGAQHAAR